MPNQVERREVVRYPLVLPIDFGRGVGVTRSVSVRGVFFDTETALNVGDRVRFMLKDIGGRIAEGVEVVCEGPVVRLEPARDGRVGVAVAIDNIVLGRDLQQPQSASLELESTPGTAPQPS